ncbi:MAG: alpha/beta hydrolase [Pseudomonadota bacterium]
MTPFIQRWGAGEYFLIHCALAHSAALAPLAEALPGGAVAYDQPGHGKSPGWDQALDYQEQCTAWAAEAMDRPGPVFGHSFGGTVALRLAVERPDLVTRLVLAEPVFFAAIRLHDEAAYAAHQEVFAPLFEAYEAGALHVMAERFTDIWGGAPWAPLPQKFKDTIAGQMPLVFAQGAGIDGDQGGVFESGRLEALDIPVTLIRGSETQPSIAAIHRVLMRLLPNAEEVVVEGAGHMAPVTHADAVAALIQP